MNTLKSKPFLFASILSLIFFSFLFSTLFGPPWGKWIIKDKFAAYLETKYEKDFIVEDISYDFFHGGTYHAYAHSMDEPEINFHVGETQQAGELEDAYHYEAMRYFANKDLAPIVENYFRESAGSIEVIPTTETGPPEEYRHQSTVEMGISLDDVTITEQNQEQEIERAAGLLFELKDAGIKFGHFGISYQNRTLQLTPDKIALIKNKDDLKKYLVPYRK